ncbi:MAG: HXXEE domain-containing protein [Bacteroidota bacterium]
MNDKQLLFASIVLLFVMLWLPMGQHNFLIDHWMKLGTYAIPFIGIGIFAFKEKVVDPPLTSNLRFIAVISLMAYILHQFEEHWIDLFGNYYAFYTFNNSFILEGLRQPDATVKPLTKESIFVINTSLVWLVGLLAILRSPKHIFPLVSMASIVLVNGIVHIVGAISKLQYNPGLFTSLVLFIPLYFWFWGHIRKRIDNYKALVLCGLIWGFLAHVIMVVGLLLANWFEMIPEYLYWFVLVIWSVVPVFILRRTT